MSLSAQGKPQALLIQLEFATWEMARPWTYSANFGVRDGLEAHGFECHTIPAIPPSPSAPSLASWLQHARQLCKGKRFDLVWVWLVHYDFDADFLEWIASLAPIRVGYVMESLSYSDEEHRFSPITLRRAAVVERQMQCLTHVLTCDELDSDALVKKGIAKATWCPTFVPERFMLPPTSQAENHVAAFHGTLYGHRRAWLEHPALKGRLISPGSQTTDIHRAFDRLQARAAQVLKKTPAEVEAFLPHYLSELRQIRLAECTQWMQELTRWACIINLPGFAKCYGGRVLEAMAVGRPVISWDIPNRPRNRSLFEDGKDILLFNQDDPSVLASHITRVLDDRDFALQLATNANRKVRSHHTAEVRIGQMLEWMTSGTEPSFHADHVGHTAPVPTHDRTMTATHVDVASRPATGGDAVSPLSPPVISIIIPCFQQAHFLSDAVESVIAQTYDNWECLIVDDGSPDNTPIIAAQLVARYPNKRLRVIRKANGGLADARNAGIREAQGRYILPLDADDRLHPDFLKDTAAVLQQQPDVSIVYVDEQNFGETSHIHRKGISNVSNLLQGNVHDYCSLYRREVWQAVGGYSRAMYIGAEDWNFWLAAAKRGFRSFHIEKPLFQYRNRAGSMVAQVHSNMALVQAHLTFHHPDLFSEAQRAQAARLLSQITVEQKQQLDRTYAIHGDDELLATFHRLAHSAVQKDETAPKPMAAQITPSHVAASGPVMPTEHEHDDGYYEDLFIRNPEWSTPEPNNDETARWVKIASILEHLVRERSKHGNSERLRILDLGCGRGWLANLASGYGDCTGVEPVSGVVAYARKLFPHVRFYSGTADTLLREPAFTPFDVVLSSEVIEHVPRPEQAEFVRVLRRLIKPQGHVIITTPRREVFDLWQKIAPPNQPVEDWLSEDDVSRLFAGNLFTCRGRNRVCIELPNFRFLPAPMPSDYESRKLIPFYQVSVWQAPNKQGAVSALPFDSAPAVTVIVPTCDRPDRLRTALLSILGQTFHDFEIIVVNDGTLDVSEVVAPLNTDGRITTIRHDRNRGLAAARNTGLRVAKGTYIAYLDDDDTYFPEHLETLVTALRDGQHKIAYTDAWRIHEERQGDHYVAVGRDLPYSRDFNCIDLLISNYFPVLCVMHEKRCLEQTGVFDESLFAHEDWDLWIRMATVHPFLHIQKITAAFTWRRDGSSMTSSTSDTYRRTTEIIYKKYRPYAERIAGVLEAQQKKLEGMRSGAQAKTFDCSIIIPVWNNLALTTQCLTALAEVTQGVSYEVIVVDNHSTDGTPAFLSGLGGDVRIITNDENLGFAKACNQGAQAAKGEYLVFLNNDTIPQTGWLSALVEEVKTHSDVAVVGSKLLYEDGTIQHAGVAFSREWFLPYHLYRGGNAQAACVSRRREMQCVTAACMLVRRNVFEQAGGFDEGYRNGFEDVDLCLKIRKLDWKVVYQPQSVLYHLESKTPGRKAHEQDNSRRLQERWGACWWLADEDLLHFEDGYAVHSYIKDGMLSYRLDVIADAQTTAQRSMLADIQRAGMRQDCDAVAGYLRRVQEWPSDPWILRWGALLCTGIAQPTLAIPFWKRILSIEECPYARIGLAKQALETGAFQDADHHLAALLEHEPSHGEGWLLRGIVAMQRLAYAESERAFEQARRFGADQRKATMGLVMALMGGNQPEAAWTEIVALCAHEPDDEECMHWLLRCGTMLQRWEALAARLSSFVARNPGNIAVRFALAGVLLRAGRRVDAQREYDWLRAMVPTFEGMDELAKQLAESERRLVPNHAA